jgi:hypothetical protein
VAPDLQLGRLIETDLRTEQNGHSSDGGDTEQRQNAAADQQSHKAHIRPQSFAHERKQSALAVFLKLCLLSFVF